MRRYTTPTLHVKIQDVDISGVSLGDVVQVVDRYFNADGGIGSNEPTASGSVRAIQLI